MTQVHYVGCRSPLEDVAVLHLRVDLAGDVRWANERALRLLRAPCPRPADVNLASLAHRDESHGIQAALADTVNDGHAQIVVRLAAATDVEPRRYAHLVLSRSGAARLADHRPVTELMVHGWEISEHVLGVLQAEALEHRDPLTRLADRTAFMARLRHEIACSSCGGTDVAVLLAHVDGFEAMADTHGPAVCDTVIREIGRRLAASLGAGDTPARIGGGEFAVICSELVDPVQPMTVADRLRTAVAEPMTVRGSRQSVTVSVCVAFASGDDTGDRAEALLRRAERAHRSFKPGRDPVTADGVAGLAGRRAVPG